jgi:hypothetical protein
MNYLLPLISSTTRDIIALFLKPKTKPKVALFGFRWRFSIGSDCDAPVAGCLRKVKTNIGSA